MPFIHGYSICIRFRFGKPHDISAAAAFLASDDGSFVTGENLVVAGGMASRL